MFSACHCLDYICFCKNETKMKPTNKKFRLYLIIAILFIILAGIILIMADGSRRWYSGGFFLIMGGVVLSKAIYEYRKI